MEECEDSQFSVIELAEKMKSYLPDDIDGYSRPYFKKKLVQRYGDALFFTEIPGAQTIVNFKGSAGSVIYDKWYSERKSSAFEEKLRIIQAAADIIRQDIRSVVHQLDEYPLIDPEAMTENSAVPDTLRHFLKTVKQVKARMTL